jgi:hypothetical protein
MHPKLISHSANWRGDFCLNSDFPMASFNLQRLPSRPILKYGLLAFSTCIVLMTLAQLPAWVNSSSVSEKEVLVRHFLSHASELAIHYQQNQMISSVSIPN